MGTKCMFCGEGELEQIDKDIEFATGTISDLKLAAYVEGHKSNFPQELLGSGTIKLRYHKPIKCSKCGVMFPRKPK